MESAPVSRVHVDPLGGPWEFVSLLMMTLCENTAAVVEGAGIMCYACCSSMLGLDRISDSQLVESALTMVGSGSQTGASQQLARGPLVSATRYSSCWI
jgi:hypothetical protein